MRIVSYPAWPHCVSYRQETFREGFPARLGTVAFLTDRKLFANGFLLDVVLWCFLPTGNFSRIVSYSTWHCGVSYRQETVCKWFPTRLGTVVFLTGRKLFAKGFLLGVAPLCFLPTGNFSRRVSYSAWRHCVSYRQETFRWEISRLRFATLEMTEGRGGMVFLIDRKLFAKGFLLDLALWCFLPAGNFSRRVSCSTWLHCVSCRQETFREGFPTRRGSTVFLTGRKLFAKGFLLGVAPLRFIPAGNCLRRVSCSTWLHCVSCRRETVCEGFPARRGSIVFHGDRKLSDGRFLDSASLRSK